MNEALQAALFAVAIQFGGYTDFCKTHECKPAALSRDTSVVGGTGAYICNATKTDCKAHVRHQGELRDRITYVHEQIHHLQRISGRYPYKGKCNMWGAEREAYKGAGAYALTQGVDVAWVRSYSAGGETSTGNSSHDVKPHARVCRAAVERGILFKPAWYDEAIKDLK